MGERKSFLLRLEEEDLEELKRWAEDEFRSLNGQIEFILRRALTRQRGFKAKNVTSRGHRDPE